MNRAERIHRTRQVVKRRIKSLKLERTTNVLFNPLAHIKWAIEWGRDPELEVRRMILMEKEWLRRKQHIARTQHPYSCSCPHCKAEQYMYKMLRRKKRYELKKELKQLDLESEI